MIHKTFRLFISSTFSDFLKEREILNTRINAKLEEFCALRGYDFQFIDLRWGVSTESALNQRTMEICLNEVRRCLTYSPKPNFLLLIGDRYGWIPLPSKIPSGLFERLYALIPETDRELVDEWYLPDENAVEGEYCLRPRSAEYINEDIWKKTYEKLMQIFTAAISKVDPCEEWKTFFGLSATEQEIIEGLLSTDSSNVVSVFRKNSDQRDEGTGKIERLKKTVSDKMAEHGKENDLIRLDFKSEDYESDFERLVFEKIAAKINEEIIRLERVDTDKARNAVLAENYQAQGKLYFREAEMAELENYINSDSRQPMLVHGEPGSGKSCLLAEFVNRNPQSTHFIFFSLDETSCNLLNSLRDFCRNAAKDSDSDSSMILTYQNVQEILQSVLKKLPDKEKLTLVIDGFDMFYDICSFRGKVFPYELPQGVKLIISYADEAYAKLLPVENAAVLNIGRFDRSQCEKIIGLKLDSAGRTLSRDQYEIVDKSIRNGVTPLMLRLICDECIGWRSTDRVSDIPSDALELSIGYINKMFLKYGHKEAIVLYTAALIAEHPLGITEKELLKILLKFNKAEAAFKEDDLYDYSGDVLPYAVWSRLYFDMQACLHITYHNGDMVIKFYHNIFRTAFRKYYDECCGEAQKELLAFYMKQDNYISTERLIPDGRKTGALSVMLLRENDTDRIAAVLDDLSFSDASIKNGESDTLLSLYECLIEADKASSSAMQLYRCIRRNETRLRCYKNSFLTCCYEDGITSVGKPVMFRSGTDTEIQYQKYFPYPPDRSAAFSSDLRIVAVKDGHTVSVFDTDKASERYRIVCPGDKTITGILWLNSDTLAVKLSDKLYLYRLSADSYSRFAALDDATDKTDILFYHEEYGIFYYFTDTALEAYSTEKGQRLFRIPAAIHGGLCAGICGDGRSIYLFDKRYCCELYRADSGEHTGSVTILKRHYLFLAFSKTTSEKRLLSLPDNRWLFIIYNTLLYIDASENSYRFIHLPTTNLIVDAVCSGGILYFQIKDSIVRIDPQDGYRISSYPVLGVISMQYCETADRLCVLTQSGCFLLPDDAFIRSDTSAFVSRRAYSHSVSYGHKYFGDLLGTVKQLVPMFLTGDKAFPTYRSLYYFSQMDRKDIKLLSLDTATQMVFSRKGHRAIAYEGTDSVVVFSPDGSRIIIDKMRFSPLHTILKMAFSDSGNTFFVMTNDALYIVDTAAGKKILCQSLRQLVITDIGFEGTSEVIFVTPESGERCRIEITDGKSEIKPPLPQKTEHGDLSEMPYQIIRGTVGDKAVPVISTESTRSENSILPKMIGRERCYLYDNGALYFRNGRFFRTSDDSEPIGSGNNDFAACESICEHEDLSEVESFIRKKNDLSSEVISSADGRYLILISYLLNSVIVFDLCEDRIISAYKHKNCIIGYRIDSERNSVELYSPFMPNKTVMVFDDDMIRLPS